MQKLSDLIQEELAFHGYNNGQSQVSETHNWMRWETENHAQNLNKLLATNLNFDQDHQDHCEATQLDFKDGCFFIQFLINRDYPSKIFNLCQDTYEASLMALQL